MSTDLPILGTNDEDGTVRCGLCDWTGRFPNMERIEFELARHLWDAHGKRLFYRRESGIGPPVDIPRIDGAEL